MVKSKISLGCMAALAAASPSTLAAKARSMHAVIVTEPVRPRYGWGVLAIFTQLFVREDSGRNRVLYLPYSGEDHVLPKRGQRCSILYRFGTLRGWVAETDTYLPRAPIVGKYNCTWPTAVKA